MKKTRALKVHKVLKSIRSKKVLLVLYAILVLVIVFNAGNVVWQQKGKYLSKNYWQRFPTLKEIYYNSIYANKKGTWVPDETLYSYNGGALIRGKSPILVNPEIPPTGKYLIGLSALLFDNENIITLFSFVVSLVLVFLIGRQIFSSTVVALLPCVFLSFEPLFKNQLVYTPLLDIIHLMFLLASFYFFNRALKNSKHSLIYFLFTSIFFGLFISTKFFGAGVPVILSFLSVLIFRKNMKELKLFTATIPLSILVLLISYTRVLIIGYPFSKFLGIQKWVFLYNKGHLHLPFSVWPLLLFNKWYVWYGNKPVISDPQWLISWPLITIISLITVALYLLKKIEHNKNVEVLMAWALFYLLFFSVGEISSRYFVILIPVLYIIAVYGVSEAYSLLKVKKFIKL